MTHQPTEVPDIPSEDSILSHNHTLFWYDKPVEFKTVEEITDSNIFEQIPGFTVYKLFIGDFGGDVIGMQRIINKLQEAGPEDMLEIHIASDGGEVDDLIQLYNLCNSVFYKRVVTYVSHAYSAGAWTFLMGNERVLYEHSSLMWHSYSGGFGGKRQDLLDRVEHEDARLERFLMGTLSPYFSKKEIRKMNKGKDYWVTTMEACQRGICTHVLKDGKVITAKDYITPKKTKKTKKTKKI